MSVYITGGSLHRRAVSIPDLQGLRPTSAKVRQALFNILGQIQHKTVLDLFSGSGLMSLEALSRGAIVTSVECEKRACHEQQKLKEKWQLEQWRIVHGQVESQLHKLKGQSFDMVFADPPYDSGWCQKIPQLLSKYQINTSSLIIEELASIQPCWPQPWICRDSRRYGQTNLHFLESSPRT
ncbi:MAG: 16S rRNA (guanine(966)-N(2))-methyltransferase RsmD [Mariprofundaceae bacterium]|nr:16S rRNA (guanine(966)-N(2))-methyltransferase RsmD [Mariprofundaceae bacterium]